MLKISYFKRKKILSISLKLNFTPNTLGCSGLIRDLSEPKTIQFRRPFEPVTSTLYSKSISLAACLIFHKSNTLTSSTSILAFAYGTLLALACLGVAHTAKAGYDQHWPASPNNQLRKIRPTSQDRLNWSVDSFGFGLPAASFKGGLFLKIFSVKTPPAFLSPGSVCKNAKTAY